MKPNLSPRYLIILVLILISQISQAQYYSYVDPNTRTLDINYAKPGTLPGSIDITSIGEAVYEIPLFISPGTAGIQPRISIVYRSNIEDGVLGRGFTIGGLSEIRRIPQNFYHDSNITGITLQNTDKFALDSNRLILTSGIYGADTSKYATEIETFVKVIAHGSAGTGPSWFEVHTKDGRTIEYGNTADSKTEATGSSTVYMWRVNKIKDPNNNYIDFKYEESNGESIIKEIKYTGNSATGLQPYNKIKFIYSSNPREDLNTYYVAGSQVPSTKLLDSIRVMTEGNILVRGYKFKYNNQFYSHLNQIKEYGSDSTYFNATIFGWGATQYPFLYTNTFNNSKKDKFYLGDFNGDGRTDFVVTENKTSFTTSDKWKLYLATSTGTSFTSVNEGSLNPEFKGFYVTDADGNGKDDILWRARETVYYQCNPHPCDYEMMESVSQAEDTVAISDDNVIDYLNPPPPQDTCWDQCSYYQEAFRYYYYNGSILTRGSTSYDLVFSPNGPADITLAPVELDGNGKPDYLVLTSTKNVYAILGITLYGYPDFNSPGSVSIVDFDGDGKKDILVIKNTNSTVYSYNTLTGYFTSIYSSSSFPTINDRIFPGDFNGDKKTDLLYWRSGSGWSLKFSTGTGFVTSSNIPSLVNTDPGASTTDNNYYIGDFNGDHKDDIIESNKSSSPSKLKRFFSRGDFICHPGIRFIFKISNKPGIFSDRRL